MWLWGIPDFSVYSFCVKPSFTPVVGLLAKSCASFVFELNVSFEEKDILPCVVNAFQSLWAFDTFNQLIRDIRTFNAHDAFLSSAVTQEIDAAIPHSFLIHDCEFLMNIGFKNNTYIVVF